MWRAAHVTTQNKKSDVPSGAKFDQGCALAEPGGPWCLTFALGRLEISDFSYKSYAGHPGFYSFRALGSLQFSLEHSLV